MTRLTLLGALLLAYMAPAQSALFTMQVNADNFYLLYTGTANSATYLGGDTSTNGYAITETYTADLAAGDYVYAYAWDTGYREGFAGAFTTSAPGFSNFYTGFNNGWEYILAPTQITAYGSTAVPALDDIDAVFSTNYPHAWATVSGGWTTYYRDPSASYNISGADWIWGDERTYYSNPGSPSYVFRYQVTGPESNGVPEPSSLLLLGAGLLGMFGLLKRKIY